MIIDLFGKNFNLEQIDYVGIGMSKKGIKPTYQIVICENKEEHVIESTKTEDELKVVSIYNEAKSRLMSKPIFYCFDKYGPIVNIIRAKEVNLKEELFSRKNYLEIKLFNGWVLKSKPTNLLSEIAKYEFYCCLFVSNKCDEACK